MGQCVNPTIPLPDASNPVNGNVSPAYCADFTFDPDISGIPLGITMGLTHTFQGDLGIFIVVNGVTLNVMQRPGTNNCNGGCPCGLSTDLSGTYIFQDGGGPDPDAGLALGGGNYGVTTNDPCGVGDPGVNSFASLWAAAGVGPGTGPVTATICIADHAGADSGTATNVSFLFPTPIQCGCTDPAALNFNPSASVDDGSCIYDCPDFNLTVNNTYYEFCEGNNSFNMLANAPGAFPPVTYEWTATNGGDAFIANPFSSNTAVNLTPGFSGSITYTLTVQDGLGCIETIEVEVEVGAGPDVEIVGEDATCQNGEVMLSLVGGPFDDIIWSTGDGTEDVLVGPGSYSVTVSDEFGCENTATFNVGTIPAPVPTVTGPPFICNPGTATISVVEFYDAYEWSTGEGTFDIEVTSPGTYFVTVTDLNGCEGVGSYTLNPAPPINLQILGTLFYCEGGDTYLDAGPFFDTYEWSTGDTSSDILVNEPGTYSVTVTDMNGCERSTSVNVTERPAPEPTITGADILCIGELGNLQVTPAYNAYSWSTGGSLQSTSISDPGTYFVTVTDAFGCQGETDYEVIAGEEVIASVDGDLFFCPGGSTTLSITPGYDSYLWSDGSTLDERDISVPNFYMVTVTSVDGCTEVVSFNVIQLPMPFPTISGDLSICDGETTDLVVDGLWSTYEWSDGSTGFEITVDVSDTYSVTVTDDNGCEGEASTTVVVNELPDIEIMGPDELCTNVAGTLSISGSFQSVTWSEGGAVGNINTIVGPGFYSVDVIDNNGCPGSASIEVLEGVPEPVEITGTSQICTGESTTLTATPGFVSYTWSNNATTPTISVTTANIYSVLAIDDNGCESLGSFEVQVVPPITPVITGDLTICPGASTLLSADEGYTAYSWSNGGNQREISVNTPGTYTVTVTGTAGCTGTASVTVTQVPNPQPQILGDLILCVDEVSTLSLSQNYASYSWSTTSTDPSIDVMGNSNTYSVTVTDTEGCQGSTSATTQLVVPTVSITGDDDFCIGQSTTLGLSGTFAQYSWSTGATSPSITTSAEEVSITVTDVNGCTATDTLDITIFPLPVVDITGRLTFCPVGGSVLSATPGFSTYLWSNNANTSTISINQEGNYSVTVTDANGCQNNTSVLTIEDAELNPIVEGALQFCAGTSTTLTVTGDYATYVWSDGVQGATRTVTTPGTYTVSVTDTFGCAGDTDVVVAAWDLPTPTIGGVAAFCVGESTLLNGGNGYATYQWSVAGQTDQFINISTPGTLGLTVTDNNGCIGTTSRNVVENPLPVIAIQGVPGFCPNLTTTLTAPAGFNAYRWSTGATGQSIAVGTTETFALTVTDANGCDGTATLDVAVYPTEIPAIAGNPQFCPDESTVLTAAPGFQSYNWSNGATTAQLTTGVVGTISVEVTDVNGCITSNTATLSEYIVTPPAIDAVAGFCTGTTADLTATPGYATYTWSNGGDTAGITVDAGGVYTVSVTDMNGCPSEQVVAITRYPLPTPNIGGSRTFCIGNSTTLNAGATYSAYLWSTGGTSSEQVINTPGNVGLTVTDANGCVGSTTAFVNEATELSPVISGELDFCTGLSTNLSAGNGFATYEWSTGATTPDITVNTPGTYSLSVTDAGGCAGVASVTVIENPLPQPVISGELAFCAQTNTVLSATPGFETYRWSTNSPSPNITVSTPNTYSLTVTDANGCINSTSVDVAELPLPVFSITGAPNFCAGATTQLSVVPAYAEYAWSQGGTTQSISVSNSSTVGVTVTDAFGCESSGALAVATVPLPLADAGGAQALDCDTRELQIGGTGSSTGAQFSYQWSGPGINATNANEPQPIVTEPGVYQLVVTNETFGCVSTASQVVVDELSYTPQIVLLVLDVLDCATSTVQIDARNSVGGPQYIYQWYDENQIPIANANSRVLTVGEAQFYFLEVIDTITGCQNIEGIEVEENELYPVPEAGEDQLLTCGEPVATLSGAGSETGAFITYQWSSPLGSGAFVGGTSSINAMVNQPGWYYLQVTDSFNGCANIDSVFVSQDIAFPTAQTSEDVELDCNIPTTVINGQGSSVGSLFTYQWFLDGVAVPDATTLTLAVETPGMYRLVVTNTENACASQSDVRITLNPAAPQALLFVTDTPTCAGDDDGAFIISGMQGGTPPYLYSVNGSTFGTQTLFNNITAGAYTVLAEDALGCRLSTTVNVPDGNDLYIDLELGVRDSTHIKFGELVSIYPFISVDSADLVRIDWQTVATLPCPGCVNQEGIALSESTQFFLTVEDINGCQARDQVTIFVSKDRNVYVPTAFSPNGDGQNDVFHIFADSTVANIRSFLVFNRWGESVFEVYDSPPNNPQWGWDGTYREQPVNAAVYVWFAEVEFFNGDVEVFKGDVIIMR